MDDRLYRSRTDRMIAGVAGGLAEHYDLDPSLVRIGWALLILFTGGLFFLLYIVMAIVVPEEPLGGRAGCADGHRWLGRGPGVEHRPDRPRTDADPSPAWIRGSRTLRRQPTGTAAAAGTHRVRAAPADVRARGSTRRADANDATTAAPRSSSGPSSSSSASWPSRDRSSRSSTSTSSGRSGSSSSASPSSWAPRGARPPSARACHEGRPSSADRRGCQKPRGRRGSLRRQASRAADDGVDVRRLGHHDERADHAEHAVHALDVGQDVAVERPDPRPRGGDHRVLAFARVDAERVGLEAGAAERDAVAGRRRPSRTRGCATDASSRPRS